MEGWRDDWTVCRMDEMGGWAVRVLGGEEWMAEGR